MSAKLAAVSPAEDTPSAVIRNRVVCFVNDDLSAAALRTGLEGSNLEVKRGTIRNAIKMLETDTELLGLVATSAKSMIPSRNWKGCRASARPMSGWR